MAKPEAGSHMNGLFELPKLRAQHGFDGAEYADIVAPSCAHCGCWIIGDEVQFAGQLFCGVECAWLAIQAA
jgi:hypothetical protein